MANDTLIWRTLRAMTDTSVPILPIDQLTVGANNGVRFLFDLANGLSYVAGTPTQGKAVADLAQISANGQVNTSGGSLSYAGNGIDFTSSTGRAAVTTPAGVLADLYALQHYLLCGYYKIPLIGDFPVGGSGQHTTLMTAQSGDTDFYTGSAEIVQVAWNTAATGRLTFTLPATVGSAGAESINLDLTSHAGLVAQVAMWRNAGTGWSARVKSSAGTTLSSGPGSAKSTGDFSAKAFNWGMSGLTGVSTTSTARKNMRLFRGFIENLNRSGRAPATVLDDDYARTIARGVYS